MVWRVFCWLPGSDWFGGLRAVYMYVCMYVRWASAGFAYIE